MPKVVASHLVLGTRKAVVLGDISQGTSGETGVRADSPEKIRINDLIKKIQDCYQKGQSVLARELTALHEQSLYLERQGRVYRLQQEIAENLIVNYTMENYFAQKQLYNRELKALLASIIQAHNDYLDQRDGTYNKQGVLLRFTDPLVKKTEQRQFEERVNAEFEEHFQWKVPENEEVALKSPELSRRSARRVAEQLESVLELQTTVASPMIDINNACGQLMRSAEQNIFYQLCITGDLSVLKEKLEQTQSRAKEPKKFKATLRRQSAQTLKPSKIILEEEAPYALHVACAAGKVDIATFLMASGMEQVPDRDGYYPLHYAAMDISGEKSIESLETLLLNGANINQPTPNGQTALDLAIFYQRAAFVALLCVHGAAINGLSDGICMQSPLHAAVRTGNLGIVQYLLHNGAHAHQQNQEGRTPLLEAFLNQSFGIVRVFLDFGIGFSAQDRAFLGESLRNKAFETSFAARVQAVIQHPDQVCMPLLLQNGLAGAHSRQRSGLTIHHEPDPQWSDDDDFDPRSNASVSVEPGLSSVGSGAQQSPYLKKCLRQFEELQTRLSPSSTTSSKQSDSHTSPPITPGFRLQQAQRSDTGSRLKVKRGLSSQDCLRQDYQSDNEHESVCSTPSPDRSDRHVRARTSPKQSTGLA